MYDIFDKILGKNIKEKLFNFSEQDRLRQKEAFERELRQNSVDLIKYKNKIKAYDCNLTLMDIETKNFDTLKIATDNFKNLNKILNWIPDETFGYFLYGLPGTGKTHILKALANKWVSSHYSVHFISTASLFSSLKSNFDDLQTLLAKFKSVDLLLLDDIGAEKKTEWNEDIFCQILDFRISQKKNIFCTSNIFPKDLQRHYNVRIVDRLNEMVKFMHILGETKRKIEEGE